MHEIAITENLIEIALEEGKKNNLTSITEIRVVIGRLHQLVPDLLQTAFEIVSENTIAEDSKLEIEWISVRMKCNDCDNIFTIKDDLFICQECASFQLTQLGGKELYVKSIEGIEHGNNNHEKGSGQEPEQS